MWSTRKIHEIIIRFNNNDKTMSQIKNNVHYFDTKNLNTPK